MFNRTNKLQVILEIILILVAICGVVGIQWFNPDRYNYYEEPIGWFAASVAITFVFILLASIYPLALYVMRYAGTMEMVALPLFAAFGIGCIMGIGWGVFKLIELVTL